MNGFILAREGKANMKSVELRFKFEDANAMALPIRSVNRAVRPARLRDFFKTPIFRLVCERLGEVVGDGSLD